MEGNSFPCMVPGYLINPPIELRNSTHLCDIKFKYVTLFTRWLRLGFDFAQPPAQPPTMLVVQFTRSATVQRVNSRRWLPPAWSVVERSRNDNTRGFDSASTSLSHRLSHRQACGPVNALSG